MGRGVYTVEPRRNSRYTAAPMAKGKRNKEEAPPADSGAKSLLDVAWRAYQAGNSVLARKAANLLLSGTPKEADESLAKKLGKQLFVGKPEDSSAKQVATELSARTRMAAKPYLFALMAAAIWLVMVAIANRH